MLLTNRYLNHYDMQGTTLDTIGTDNGHRIQMSPQVKIGFSKCYQCHLGPKPTSDCGKPIRLHRIG